MSYVIATRKVRRGKYRTRYYRETRDGRSRFGTKAQAARFSEEEANLVVIHIRAMNPRATFNVVHSTARPPRPRPGDLRHEEHVEREQVDAFPTPL